MPSLSTGLRCSRRFQEKQIHLAGVPIALQIYSVYDGRQSKMSDSCVALPFWHRDGYERPLMARKRFERRKNMNWEGLTTEFIRLRSPLLIIKGSKGFLACGYINIETCNRLGDACAIVTGVKSHDDMLDAEIKAVSAEAEKLGVKKGMIGQEALEIFR